MTGRRRQHPRTPRVAAVRREVPLGVDPASIPWERRHAERHEAAAREWARAQEGVALLGLFLRAEDGHDRWLVLERPEDREERALLRWWPRSGRCVLRGRAPLKIHDVGGLLKVARLAANLTRREAP